MLCITVSSLASSSKSSSWTYKNDNAFKLARHVRSPTVTGSTDERVCHFMFSEHSNGSKVPKDKLPSELASISLLTVQSGLRDNLDPIRQETWPVT